MIPIDVRIPLGAELVIEKKAKKRVLRRYGNKIARAARKKLAQPGAGRRYGNHTASAPGAPPAKLTGALAQSIGVRVFKSGDGVAIRARRFYAKFLEAGAQGGIGSGKAGVKGQRNTRRAVAGNRVLEPRPFLSTAAEEAMKGGLAAELRDALINDINLRTRGPAVPRLRDRR